MSEIDPTERIEQLQQQIRGISKERDRYKADANTWQQTAAGFEAQVRELEPIKEQFTTLQSTLSASTARHEQDIALLTQGVTSPRARRAIRREYADELSELGAGAEAPPFDDFLNTLKEDASFSSWFGGKQVATPAKPAPRQPPVKPNGGTGQPKTVEEPMTLEKYRQMKAAGQGEAALKLLKEQGIIR